MKINTVALIGAGAVGAYFIMGLAKPLGDNFCVVAEGSRKKRLEDDGLSINGEHYDLNVRTPEEAHGVDLLLIATKYSGLHGALDEIRRTADDHTIIISLLNGVDSEEIVAQVIPERQILNSFMVIASMRDDRNIYFDPKVTVGMKFGDKHTLKKTEACVAVEEFFRDKACHAQFMPDIMAGEWKKFARNISLNLPQAIVGVGIAAYNDSQHLMAYSLALENEVRAVAAAYGYSFGPVPRPNHGYRKASRYSTLQDLDAKRHTEIDMFCGVLMQKAAVKNIPVPCAQMTYHIIKTLEEKNDGKFGYTEDEIM